VKSYEEQTFLSNYIFQQSGVEINVWIGGKRLGPSKFGWQDGTSYTPFAYTNWSPNFPSDISGRDCVQMVSRLTKANDLSDGLWRDVTCGLQNYYVCQKLPKWSPSKLQETLITVRKAIGL